MIPPKIPNYYLCRLFPHNTPFKLNSENLSAYFQIPYTDKQMYYWIHSTSTCLYAATSQEIARLGAGCDSSQALRLPHGRNLRAMDSPLKTPNANRDSIVDCIGNVTGLSDWSTDSSNLVALPPVTKNEPKTISPGWPLLLFWFG